MEIGVIVELGDRQSGFIRRNSDKENLFFHADALVDMSFTELKKGDTVTFSVTESKKGPYALQVKRK